MIPSTSFEPLSELRREFSGLGTRVWLNCQGSAPGASSVLLAMAQALHEWHLGTFDWRAWEFAAERARQRFAQRIGAHEDTISIMSSLAEAASTVATAFAGEGWESPQRRHIVVPAAEFRSNLMPWLALRHEGFVPRLVECGEDGLRTCDVVDAIDENVALVAISDVQSQTGSRLDLGAILRACRAAGARSFVNLTQSLGVLRFDLRDYDADFVAAHGYKWMLAPRGATWLYSRETLHSRMRALSPNWKNAPQPYQQLYGTPGAVEPTARRFDASLAWHSWVGAHAALAMLDRLDAYAIEAHALRLASECRAHLANRGFAVAASDCPTALVGVLCGTEALAEKRLEVLRQANIVGSTRGPWLRIGFHGFNTDDDMDRVLAVLR